MTPNKIVKNYVYIKQQITALLRSTSKTVKCIWLIVFISYSFSFYDKSVDIIGVTPGYFIAPSFRIWSAFTFCFLETHFWNVCIDVIMIGLCGKVIEPLWGPTEIISFFAIVNVGVALLSTIFYLFIYLLTSNPYLLFNVHIHGLSGYIAGVTVAVKQIMPDILIVKTPIGRISNKDMPFLTVLFSIIFWLVGLSYSSNLVMVMSGIYVSWIYLRFYQKHSSGSIGDMSESLDFASFFPTSLQSPVILLANTTYNLLIKMKLCKKRSQQKEISEELSGVSVNVLGLDIQDKERRKQKALKALSEHLNKNDLPRVVGTVTPQKIKNQSSTTNSENVLETITTSVETSSLLSNKQKEYTITVE